LLVFLFFVWSQFSFFVQGVFLGSVDGPVLSLAAFLTPRECRDLAQVIPMFRNTKIWQIVARVYLNATVEQNTVLKEETEAGNIRWNQRLLETVVRPAFYKPRAGPARPLAIEALAAPMPRITRAQHAILEAQQALLNGNNDFAAMEDVAEEDKDNHMIEENAQPEVKEQQQQQQQVHLNFTFHTKSRTCGCFCFCLFVGRQRAACSHGRCCGCSEH
jgi:hypothetical protein